MRQPTISTLIGLMMSLIALPVSACLNDRDTLAEEAQGLPEVVQIITGRFERNPPLYYRMRIDRLVAKIAKGPGALSDYDDIAVAYDRLHDDVDAIEWIERKKALLPPLAGAGPDVREAWYRYYANGGTFRIHHWLKAGRKANDIAEARTARSMIAAALEIKPDAHLGREKYQLRVMDWIIGNGTVNGTYYETLGEAVTFDGDRQSAVKGLSGLVVLGGAWESVDVFTGLGEIMHRQHRDNQIGYLSTLRAEELYAAGGRLILDPSRRPSELIRKPMWDEQIKDDQRTFRRLRAEADRWQNQRVDYMMARLTTGRHPDTDSTFWADYHDDGPPVLTVPLSRRISLAVGGPAGVFGYLFVAALLAVILIPMGYGLRSAIVSYRGSKR